MFERILIADDGSPPARAAVQLGFKVASGAKARVTLAYVVEPPAGLPPHAEAFSGYEELIREGERDWRDRLEDLAELAGAGSPAEPVLLRGQPAPVLLEACAEAGADLLVAGTHGVGGVRPLLGSVSHQLVEHAPCPVLLVREAASARAGEVLVALDGSEVALAAVAVAEELADALAARLRIVHVLDPGPLADLGGSRELSETLRREGQRVLEEGRTQLGGRTRGEAITELREGSPREQLLLACGERRPEVAVVASRGVGGFEGLLLGSTARALVNEASCPVLVVRSDRRGERHLRTDARQGGKDRSRST